MGGSLRYEASLPQFTSFIFGEGFLVGGFAKAGDAIMHQGAVEYSMFIVVSGTADVYVSDAKTEDPLQGCMIFWNVMGKKGGASKGNDMK